MTTSSLPARQQRLLDAVSEEIGEAPAGAWLGDSNNRNDVVFALDPGHCAIIWSPRHEQSWHSDQVRITVDDRSGVSFVQVESGLGRPERVSFTKVQAAVEIRAQLDATIDAPAEPGVVGLARVVTPPGVPGSHHHERARGGDRGRLAVRVDRCHEGPGGSREGVPGSVACRSATRANAVVGMHGTPFGAGGGITSAFGGDAVGVLLMGTAVTIEPCKRVDDASCDGGSDDG